MVSFPSSSTGSSRLSGLVLSMMLVALPVSTGGRGPMPSPSERAPVGRSTAGTAYLERWSWPVAPPHPVQRPFEAPADRYSAGHRGIDIAVAPDAPVLSPADGVVRFVGTVVDRPVVSISVPGDLIVSIEPVEPSVVEGETVRRGQLIGRRATGGHCATGCIHLGTRLRGEYLSPMLYLEGIPLSVLLPTRSLG